jgi:hypothetical protein
MSKGSSRFSASRRAPDAPSGDTIDRATPAMIAFHRTTIDCLASIERDGLRPHSFVSRSRALAGQYAWLRAMTLGADAAVVIELDVPSAAAVEAESWWWAGGQLALPLGCPPSCIVSVDRSTPPQFSPD